MKKTIYALSIVIAMVFLGACSDDSTSTPTPENTKLTKNFFGISDVSRVTFRQVRTNADTSEIANTVKEGVMEYVKDTTVWSLNSRLYTKVMNNDTEKITSEIYNMSADSNEFRIHSASINEVVKLMVPESTSSITVDLPFTLPDTMVKIGDRINKSWDIYSKVFTNFTISKTFNVLATGTLTVKGKRGAIGTTTIEGTKINTQEFILTFVFDGSYTMSGQVQPINIPIELHYVFGEGKGLVAYSIPFTTLPILGGMPIAGFSYKAQTIK